MIKRHVGFLGCPGVVVLFPIGCENAGLATLNAANSNVVTNPKPTGRLSHLRRDGVTGTHSNCCVHDVPRLCQASTVVAKPPK
jgi:hypothetical protein